MASDIQENHAKFKQLVPSLDPKKPKREKVQQVKNITAHWVKFSDSTIDVTATIKDSKLLLILADILEENHTDWAIECPEWLCQVMWCLTDYIGEPDLFPLEQFRAVWRAFRKYIMLGCFDVLGCMADFLGFPAVKQFLLQDNELLNILKKKVRISAAFFRNFVTSFEPAQLALLHDRGFILSLLALPEHPDVWGILYCLSQQPDAKQLLPREVLIHASKSNHFFCSGICLMLYSDDDLRTISLKDDLIELAVSVLNKLVTKGTAKRGTIIVSLLDLVLPVANLSVVDSLKEKVGNLAIPALMQIVADSLPNNAHINLHLPHARQEASRALWNFAYIEPNRILIAQNDGIAKLNKALENTSDPILKKNISGILHMFTVATTMAKPSNVPPTKGHIMISYNWGHQPTIKRIAQSLKERGYNVWLDVEQMAGSTLDAMAKAVEGSEVVLMCMSQKYKDSPNCRLEGEYCVNRRIEFIPLMVQPNYKPDGWLGITLGTKLWYDFTDECNWDAKMAELLKGLGVRGLGTSTPIMQEGIAEKQSSKKPVAAWTLEEVHEWLKLEQIGHLFELFKKQKFDGRALNELKRLHSLQNPVFLQYFQQQLGIAEFGEMLRLSDAIHKL